MHKKRDLSFMLNLDKNINLFRQKALDGNSQDLQIPVQKTKTLHLYFQDQNKTSHHKTSHQNYINKPLVNNREIKPCNFHSSTYKSYFGYDTSNTQQQNIIFPVKNTNKQKTGTKDNRKSSIQKENQSTGSKNLSIRYDQGTPTFSLIEDPTDKIGHHHAQNAKQTCKMYVKTQQKASSNKYLDVETAKKALNFKHQRHNSQQYQRKYINCENVYEKKGKITRQSILQKYAPMPQSTRDRKQIVVEDLKTRLQKQLQKNEQLNHRCKMLLQANQHLKATNQMHKNSQLLKQNHKIQAQLEKWRKIINYGTNLNKQGSDTLDKKKHSNSFKCVNKNLQMLR